jgi:pimeloyl-ACP methyl ester carboxylesterase
MVLLGRRRLALAAATSLVIGIGVAGGGAAWADTGSGDIISVPVSFDVVTKNDSGIPCDTSNPLTSLVGSHHETVRGHLTGPRDELDRDHVDGTVYSHGDGYRETFWRFTHDEDYNYVDQMARRGHVSVTIDRLGYGRSSKPNGNFVCFGTEATVLHQIIGRLRDGHYDADRDHAPRFDKVGLVGHSASGFIVEQEAAGFHDIDALGVLDSGEIATQPLTYIRAGQTQMRCLTAPDGYAGFEANAAEFRHDHLVNVKPEIADYLTEHRTNDACAGTRNSPQAEAGNGLRNSLIRVPVLVLGGAEDKLFNLFALQAKEYPQSRKVTLRIVPRTGHAVAFSREHRTFANYMDHWLDDNDL